MSKESKLKPCPFCGAKANLVNVRGRWAVECSKKCVGTVIKNDQNKVIEIWNRRDSKLFFVDFLEKDLREYAEQKFQNGEIELAHGILKAVCRIKDIAKTED